MTHPFQRLLLATEHTAFDSGAEALALALAQQCRLPLAAVLPMLSNAEFEMVAPQLAHKADADMAERRQALLHMAQARGVPLDVQVRRGPELAAEITAHAQALGSDLLIIRRRGERGFLSQLLVGEMVRQVVAQAPCSVLVAPRGAALWTRRVMLGVDPEARGGPCQPSIESAAAIAATCGLPLHLVCVAGTGGARALADRVLDEALLLARQALARLQAAAADAPGTLAASASVQGEVCTGRPFEALLAAARDRGADLLVVAHHSRAGGGAGAGRTGSTAQKVVAMAAGPVLVHVNPQIPSGTPA